MTLREWRAANPDMHVQPYGRDGALQVFHNFFSTDETADSQWNLFHLSDYVVSSSTSGPSLILVPRGTSIGATPWFCPACGAALGRGERHTPDCPAAPVSA